MRERESEREREREREKGKSRPMTRDRKRSESVRDYPWEQWPPNRCLHSSDYGSKVDGRLDWADLLDRCVHGVTDGYKPKLMYYVVSGIWREDRQRLK